MKNLELMQHHDDGDPNPWLAMYLDQSIPLAKVTKEALLNDNNSRSTKYLLPVLWLWSKCALFVIHIFKYFFPKLINSSKILHQLLSWGLRNFVSPSANTMIFRHFHVGSEILQFIAGNIDGLEMQTSPLKPKDFEAVKEDLFLLHDLNLYNFVIKLNDQLQENNLTIEKVENLDLSMITREGFDHIEFPNRWTNVLDLRSAIEVFTPFYQLFLTSNDFLRATNSLQLDETIAIYACKILGENAQLNLVNNRHPLVPMSTYSASYRLVLHGLAAETLHAILVSKKPK